MNNSVNVVFRPLHIGIDFNVGHMAACVGEYIDGILYIIKEYINFIDTPDLIEAVKQDFSSRKIYVYPDATGVKRGSTNASISDIALLREAKFTVKAKTVNPFVKNRIAAVNRAFEKKRLRVNAANCQELTEALEQQVYKENGSPDKDSGLDHILDALGYMVYYLMPVRETGIKKRAFAS